LGEGEIFMRVMAFGSRPGGDGPQVNWVNQKNQREAALEDSVSGLDSILDEFSRKTSIQDASRVDSGIGLPERPATKLAFQDVIQNILDRLHDGYYAPPQEIIRKDRPRKVEVAQKLTGWMTQTLAEQDVRLAVVTRQGGLQHKKHDKTGMFHSGIALFHPREKKWKIYNLVDEQQAGRWRCEVQWTEPEDFFYQQGGYQAKSLLLIPDKKTQERMTQALLRGDYKKLLFTDDYHLVSSPESTQSLNCNKWVLLNVLAAQKQQYNPRALLADIQADYKPDLIDVHPVVRPFARYQPHIKGDEIPLWGPIYTVTVNSLVESGLFERTLSCAEEDNRIAM
jgi:hypothetical protein